MNHMSTIRFVMVGGFLGAGKTTTLGRLARHYMTLGKRVGIITNDQAEDLVDTHLLREQGFPVEEVAGACFCCKFDDLLNKVGALQDAERPDIIFAEPVGSCTDLVATVVQPLKDLYGARFSVAPYVVLFKPSHGLKILRNEGKSGFSPKAAYIFRKQLEEADAIAVNRIDEMSEQDAAELTSLVKEQYPGTPILRVSAKTGAGFEALTHTMEQQGVFGRKILDIDYDIYAEGEAELGWLNSSVRIRSTKPFDLDGVLVAVTEGLQKSLRQANAEVGHLKAIGLWEGFFGVANLTSNDGAVTLSLPSHSQATEADLIINARAAIDPEELKSFVNAEVARVCGSIGATSEEAKTQSFRPGRPTPTHRYAEAK